MFLNNKNKHKQNIIPITSIALAILLLFTSSFDVCAKDYSYSIGDTEVFYQTYFGGDTIQAVYDFAFSDNEQTYVIEKSGNYEITALGAAGADYTGLEITETSTVSYTGGEGGITSGYIKLNKGDIISVTTGKVGAGGLSYTSVDETANSDEKLHIGKGSNGGSATIVKINGEVVMIAGGGGGASAFGAGGAAGTGGSSTSKGGSGIAGGGDGYEGGSGVQFELHHHTGDSVNGGGCYTVPITHNHIGDSSSQGGCYTIPVYHVHVYVKDGQTKPVNPSEYSTIISSKTNPGGCYVAAGHKHNATGTCPTHQEGGTKNCPGYLTSAQSHPWCTGGYDEGRICYYCNVCGGHGGAGAAGQKCSGKISTPVVTKYDCGSPTNQWKIGCGKSPTTPVKWDLGCGLNENQITGYDLGCGLNELNSVLSFSLSMGGSNYCSDEFKNISLSSGNKENGSVILNYAESIQTYVVPCDGDYSFESCDGSLSSEKGGAFSGKIHLKKNDIVTMVIGARGSIYQIDVNGETILKYHYHRGYGVHKTDDDNPIQYTQADPGGCYIPGGHEHNKCGQKCTFIPEVGYHPTHICGAKAVGNGVNSWIGGDGVHYEGPTYGQNADMDGAGSWHEGYGCPTHGGAKLEPDCMGGICQVQIEDKSKWIVTCPAHWDCGDKPTNIWKLGCGYYDAEAIYSDLFYDVKLDAERIDKAYCKITLYKVDYSIIVKPNGGYLDLDWDGSENNITRTDKLSTDKLIETQTGTVVYVPNPVREGFDFMGWDIIDMESGIHYYAPVASAYKVVNESENPLFESVNANSTDQDSISYCEVTPEYKYFMNLRIYNGICVMKAIWKDNSKPVLDDDWGEFGATMRNRDVEGDGQLVRVSDLLSSNRTGVTSTASLVTSNSGSFRNPDSALALFTSLDSYSISRRLGTVVMKDGVDKWKSLSNVIKSDGKGNAIYTDTVECTYSTLHSKYAYGEYILGLHKLANGKYAKDDPVSQGQYPYVYGVTADGQKYYPGTWTNKSVTITATAYDGTTGTGDKVSNRNGGTGIYRMRFGDYSRYYDGITNRDSDEWVYNEKSATTDSTADSSMTIEKTFSASGAYQISITSEDRAGTANNAAGGWIANEDGNNVATVKYGYAVGSDNLDYSTAILIDKDAPVMLDPENYLNASTSNNTAVTNVWGKMSYAKAKAMMYEGYNEVVDPSSEESEAYGWAMDYVRIVAYADDGNGSGINAKDASFCWVPDGSGVDYRNPENWQPADSSRTVNGKVYPVSTRTVSEEESGVVYVRDAVGNYAKLSYSVDHMDKEDPMVNPEKDPEPDPTPKPNPEPDPVDPTDPDLPDYTPDPGDKFTWFGSGDMEYDWINHVADIIFDADDLAANSNKRPTSGSGSKTDEAHSSSGIWKITVYESDKDFTTVKDERGRDRSPYYTGDSNYAESLFKTKLNFKVSEEGTNCFIAEILDKAGNLTLVKFVVKIDMTNPLITGNEEQVNLNKFNEDEVESAIQDDSLMSCFFDVVFDDKKSTSDVTDTSGVDYVKIRLVNPEDPDNTIYGENKEFALYKYGSGTSTLLSFDKTLENTLNFEGVLKNAIGDLTDTSVLNGEVTTKLNTFELLPNASTFFWECEVKDRAGNCAFARSNVLPNFSVKAVVHSTEDDEFNVSSDTTIDIDNNGGKSITRKQYVYKYTRPVGDLSVFGNTGTSADKSYTTYYKIPDALASAMGLTLVSSPNESSSVGMANSGSYSATNNIPYFQLGDFGYVEVWTVGYVDKIQLDFDVRGTDNIGKEMDTEISDKRVPNKYALGSNDKHRLIVASNADVVSTSHATNASGVAYAHHYGVSEATTNAWLENGTSIRMPLYYALTPDGTKKDDGSENYESELHAVAVYAWKDGWKDTSLAEYVIWDTRADDVHYRITHE